jgi:hypothetical protein
LPNRPYILTLNGNPERFGNENLPTPVPGNEQEKLFDFQIITTDSDGKYLTLYALALPKGAYDVRFYVKDTVDFKIVLCHDFFKFAVTAAETSAGGAASNPTIHSYYDVAYPRPVRTGLKNGPPAQVGAANLEQMDRYISSNPVLTSAG